ncbi:MAG: hypothetical protein ISR58_14525 [Anaerolineales bacterium]|nr:hypothetical protein [Chloroflexota bacterium]MBL6982392.1 hypothetical protein [Anaerolineales bacterium]
MGRSENLYHLQRIDSQIDDHNRRLLEIQKTLEDDRVVKIAKDEAAVAQEELNAAQKHLRSERAIVQDQRAKIEESEKRLYSGTVANPKELEDIQTEIGALKRYLDILEERQLEAMLAVDETQEIFDAAQAQLEQTLANTESRNADLLKEKSEIDALLADLRNKREGQANGIDTADLKLYEEVRTKRAGVGVAKVQERTCSACGSILASAIYQQSRSPNNITHCDTCERILYAE